MFVPELPSIRIVDLVSAMLPKASMEIVKPPGEKKQQAWAVVVRYDG